MRRLLPYLSAHAAAYLASGLLLVGSNALAVAIPALVKYAIESLRPPFDPSRTAALAGAIILFALGRALVRTASRRGFFGLSRAIEYELRNDLFRHLQKLPPLFYQRMRTGDIMSRAVNDLNAVRMVLGPGLMNACNTSLIYLFCLGAMVWLSPRLTLYTLALYPVWFLLGRGLMSGLVQRSQELHESLARLSARLHENLTGAAVVRAYCQEESEARAFASLNDDYLSRHMAHARTRGYLFALMTAMGGAGSLLVLYLGGRLVVAGEITLGSFVAFYAYLALLLWPTMALSWILSLFQRGLSAMARIGELLDEPPQEDAPTLSTPRGSQRAPIRGALEVRSLSFRYPARAPEGDGGPEGAEGFALAGVSFRVEPGGFFAIVGPVGSGKSTLAKLLLRLLPMPRGMVFLDGRDAAEMSLTELRRSVGYVPQDAFLFGEPIRENIQLGAGELGAEAVEEAARRACLAQDFDQLPSGLDTVVGERGITLSGGQRARTAFARTLVREPTVLVVDDALASVDLATEETILQELRAARRERTCLLITHRAAVAARADRIAVLSRGRLIEMGTHQELLRAGGLYAELHRQQELLRELAAR
ncbi:MAG: ABC transporter ATP-binding protein [Nitrospinota bacterium]